MNIRLTDFMFIVLIMMILVGGIVAVAGVMSDGNARQERCVAKGGVYLSSGDCVRPGVVIEVGR